MARIGRLAVFTSIPEHRLMARILACWRQNPMPTYLSGDDTATHVIRSSWPELFYNAYDRLPYETIRNMLPWAEVWVIDAHQSALLGENGFDFALKTLPDA